MSLAPGTLAPDEPPDEEDQVDVLFQLPVATAYLLAASRLLKINVATNVMSMNFRFVFIINFLSVMKKMVIIGQIKYLAWLPGIDNRIGGNSGRIRFRVRITTY